MPQAADAEKSETPAFTGFNKAHLICQRIHIPTLEFWSLCKIAHVLRKGAKPVNCSLLHSFRGSHLVT